MAAVNRVRAADAPTGLRYLREPAFPVPFLRLVGRLDEATGGRLRTSLDETLADEPVGIVLDASGLTAGEDGSLPLIRTFAETAGQWPGCPVVLCAPSTQLAETLDRLEVTPAVPVHETAATAVAAVQATPPAGRYGRRLPAVPSSARLARALVKEACVAWRVDELVTEAQILVTELVGNAVQYAGGDVGVVIRRTENLLHLGVYDRSPVAPVLGTPDPAVAESGRGLVLVDAIAAAWGDLPAGGGKLVWATLGLPD